MDIKENDLQKIIIEIITEGAEDVQSINWNASNIIIDLLKGEKTELLERILNKCNPDKNIRIIKE